MKHTRILSSLLTIVLCFAILAIPQAWTGRTVVARAKPDDEPLLVLPAVLDPRRWASARCNDGTPFGFAFEPSPTGSKEWVIYLEGGGFCEDLAHRCSDRNVKYTTKPGADAMHDWYRLRDKALFSRDPELNPVFYAANMVFAFYCSSDVWSGSNIQRRPSSGDPKGWFFSGRTNVRAMVEVLVQYHGLDDKDPETKVLYAGGSAGGEGVQATADLVQKLLPRAATDGRLKLLNDAGSVFEFDHPDYSFRGIGKTFPEVMNLAYDFWASSLNPRCEAFVRGYGASPGTCFDQVIAYPFLVNPAPSGLGVQLLVQHSSIDGYQLRAHRVFDPEGIEFFRSNTLSRFSEVSWTWLFSGGSLAYHVVTIRDDRWTMGPPGSTFRDVLARFWEDAPPEVIIYGNP